MRYRTFGRRTGLRVSEYALGTGNFGTAWGAGADASESRKVFNRFAEAGGTLIDTADGYQFGESEKLLGEFLGAERDNFVVATKYTRGASPGRGSVTASGNSRRTMVRSVEESLTRLKTDRIDLYWVHFPDGVTPMEEILRGLDDLVSSGKILHAGLSNFPAWRVSWAAATADLRGWAPLAGIQVEYSLVERTADRELLPMAEALGLGVALWSPLGGGLLTGKYRAGASGRLEDWGRLVHTEDSTQKTAVVDVLLDVAREAGVTPSQAAAAWQLSLAQQSPTTLVPVIGPRNVAQLEDYLGALDVSLSAEQLSRLGEVSAVPLGNPHEAAAGVSTDIVGESFVRNPIPVV